MKKIILFSLLVSFGFYSKAQNNSLLWEISGNGLDQSSYLYGTLHSKDSRAHQFGDSVLIKLTNADLAIFEYVQELDLDKSELGKLIMMKGVTLEDLISKKDFKFLKAQIMEKIGFAGLFFNQIKPIFTATMCGEMNSRNEMLYTVDDFFKQECKKLDKEMIGLETIEEAMASMDNISLKEQAKMLVEYFREYDEQSIMRDSLMAMYKKGDILGMHSFYENVDDIPLSFDRNLVIKRNIKFANRLIPHLKENTVFCAIGALHLPGETGLIATLRAKGFNLRPIFSDYTPTLLTIGRKDEWGYFDNDSLKMIMHFPEDPYYELSTFSNQDSSKSINLTHYFLTDSINSITYSIESGKIDTNSWTIEEIVQNISSKNNFEKLNEKQELFMGEETTILEFYASPNINLRYHILRKQNRLYIISVKATKQLIYSDLAEYFLRGFFYNGLSEFQQLLNNERNLTLDMTGTVLYENRDTVNTYQIYVVAENDTTFIDFQNKTTFTISLNLGFKYVFGFKKEGYQSKHLIIDIIEHGTIQDFKYGFEFPMDITLVKEDENTPSIHVATIKYNPFKGYIDHR